MAEPIRLVRTSEPPETASDEADEAQKKGHEHDAEWLHQQLHADMKRHLESDAEKHTSIYDTIGQCVALML